MSCENGHFAVEFLGSDSRCMIQIVFKLLPLDQRPVAVHNVKVAVRVERNGKAFSSVNQLGSENREKFTE